MQVIGLKMTTLTSKMITNTYCEGFKTKSIGVPKISLKSPNLISRWASLPGVLEFPEGLRTTAVFLDAPCLTNH